MDRAQGLAAPDLVLRTTPLCVDLDGTLLCGDTLLEGAIALLKRAPWLLPAMIWWLLAGKLRLKREVAARSPIDAARLPYRQDFLAWLRLQAGHRPVYLATAAHRSIADAVAAHLGLFAGVFASEDVNLKSAAKARALSDAFGAQGFDYAGNDVADLSVWRASGGIVVVGASEGVARAAAHLGPVLAQFDPAPAPVQRLLLWLRALRVYQWVKNLLVFVAPLAAHTLDDPESFLRTLVALVSFGLAASAVYVFNDVVDLDADRAHPRKRQRAFAAGRLPVAQALVASPLLIVAALSLAFWLGTSFALVLLSYVLLTTLYSLWLKQKLFLDVVALAGLYSVRVVGGAVASSLPLSSWLLSLCAYGFLSLALVKRFAELSTMRQEQRDALSGRAYRVEDMPVVMALGCGAGLLASLVMALYVDSEAGRMRYAHPEFLWGLSPLIIVGLGRLWLIAGRGAMHDDPVVFVARDRASLLLVAVAAFLGWAAL